MQTANSRQVGGDHYRTTYQHWDWVCDLNMPYLLACATKYITRWRKKNGIQDLEKAIHYIDKAQEEGIYLKSTRAETRLTCQFLELSVSGEVEVQAIQHIISGEYVRARQEIHGLIEQAKLANFFS